MTKLTQAFLVSLAAGTALAIVVVSLDSGPSADTGWECWNLPKCVLKLGQARWLDRELEVRRRANMRRLAAKEEVTVALIERRLTLPEAVARFRELDAGVPEAVLYLRRVVRGSCDEERYYRYAIGRVHSQLSEQSPILAEREVAELETELARHLERWGTAGLPK
jgi:hypothetical protein